MTAPDHKSVAVIGGGWAGLTATHGLVERGWRVTVFEAAKQAGGRARTVIQHGQRVDNGQHLLIGAYASTLRMLETLGTRKYLAEPDSLELYYRDRSGDEFSMIAPSLPAPLHLAAALTATDLISLLSKVRALAAAFLWSLWRFRANEEQTVAELLRWQPSEVVARLWEPICIGALNTPISQASSRLFLRVLHESFAREASSSPLMAPTVDLSRLFVEPMLAKLRGQGVDVRLGARVRTVWQEGGRWMTRVKGEEAEAFDAVVCAVPFWSVDDVLKEVPGLSLRASELQPSEIVTVYLDYGRDLGMPFPYIGLIESNYAQWVFDRGWLLRERGRVAVVTSAAQELPIRGADDFIAEVRDELAAYFGGGFRGMPLRSTLIREKRATFLATPEAEAVRPETFLTRGLVLAGDYTETGLPATLEGAVRSGEGVLEFL